MKPDQAEERAQGKNVLPLLTDRRAVRRSPRLGLHARFIVVALLLALICLLALFIEPPRRGQRSEPQPLELEQ